MKWLADENIPLASITRLRDTGIDIDSVATRSPGLADRDVLALAVSEQRALLTFDRDFGELIFRQHLEAPPCVVFLRFGPAYPEQPAETLSDLTRSVDELEGCFFVLDQNNVRKRPLP